MSNCSSTDHENPHPCTCDLGPQDPRCCIPQAQRRRDEEIWEMGRQGIPLPEVKAPLDRDLKIGWLLKGDDSGLSTISATAGHIKSWRLGKDDDNGSDDAPTPT